jgi:single-strand selective monofunctional uracil DNA glycosylase
MPPPLANITDALVAGCNALTFGPPVTHVYNPLTYARTAWDAYCEKYGQGQRDVLICGMNPGPFGMSQVGVPFGEVNFVRDWLGIYAPIGKPQVEHPRVLVRGFDCPRSEVSGARLWGWAKTRYGTPDAFFRQTFAINYCPLAFMEEGGRNRTPDKLPARERAALYAVCDRALADTIALFRPKVVVGVGHFAEARLRAVAPQVDPTIRVGRVPHPSPASPAANRDWAGQMDRAWAELGLS